MELVDLVQTHLQDYTLALVPLDTKKPDLVHYLKHVQVKMHDHL